MFEGLFQPLHLIVIFIIALVDGDELNDKQSQNHETEKKKIE